MPLRPHLTPPQANLANLGSFWLSSRFPHGRPIVRRLFAGGEWVRTSGPANGVSWIWRSAAPVTARDKGDRISPMLARDALLRRRRYRSPCKRLVLNKNSSSIAEQKSTSEDGSGITSLRTTREVESPEADVNVIVAPSSLPDATSAMPVAKLLRFKPVGSSSEPSTTKPGSIVDDASEMSM